MALRPTDTLQKTAKSTFWLPSCWTQETDILRLSASSDVIGRHFCNAIQCVTPIAANRCHWWWETTQDYGCDLRQQWQATHETILEEDKDMLEAVQVSIDEDMRGKDARDLLISADRPVIDVRRALRGMIKAEPKSAWS